jgi:hypothetical protein
MNLKEKGCKGLNWIHVTLIGFPGKHRLMEKIAL